MIAEPLLADARLSTEEEYIQQLQQQSESCMVADTPEPEKENYDMSKKIQTLSKPNLKSAAIQNQGECDQPSEDSSDEDKANLSQRALEAVSDAKK